MLKLSSVIVANLQEMAISIWLNTVLPFFHVHMMSVYFIFTMYGMFTNFETVWNGYLMDMTLFYGFL